MRFYECSKPPEAATGGVLWKRVFKNFANFTGKHLCQKLFLIKFERLQRRCFLVKFWRTHQERMRTTASELHFNHWICWEPLRPIMNYTRFRKCFFSIQPHCCYTVCKPYLLSQLSSVAKLPNCIKMKISVKGFFCKGIEVRMPRENTCELTAY